MTSTAANDNSISVTQPAQFSLTGTKSVLTPTLASLASVTELTDPSVNPQQTSVATFPQRSAEGSLTGNTGSSSGVSPSQTPTQPFQFTKSSPSDASTFPFANQPTANVPRFSSTNPQPANASNTPLNQSITNVPQFSPTNSQAGNPSNFSFNQPTANVLQFSSTKSQLENPLNFPRFSFTNSQLANTSDTSFNQSTVDTQVQQRLGSFTITPSAQKQEIPNNKTQFVPTDGSKQTPDEVTRSTANNASTHSKKLSDPPTAVSEQSNSFNQEQEESDTPATLAENSLISKQLNTKLRGSAAFVVDRSDPNSTLYSLTSFEQLNLKPDLLKGIYNMGFRTPSQIQKIALTHLLANPPKNIIAQSQSGTGKTAAFSLAILSRINPSIQSPQALILAPTFELALHIGSVIERMAQFLPYIKIAYAVRDRAKSNIDNFPPGQLLSHPIVIGTLDTIEKWSCRRVIDLSQLHICCVDEADIMIATYGLQETCVDLIRDLNHSNCQIMLFSATYSDDVMAFARGIISNPAVLRVKRDKQMLNNIRQFSIECCTPERKYIAIEQIFGYLTVGQGIIFCGTKATAHELAVGMANQNHSVRELTAALEIEQRASIIQQFRDGLFRVLISTNVGSRGIDIDDVSLVINYDMPVTTTFHSDHDTYLSRIGRCGRFGKLGYAFSLIGSEKDFNTMREIEEYFSHPIHKITIEEISQLEQDQE